MDPSEDFPPPPAFFPPPAPAAAAPPPASTAVSFVSPLIFVLSPLPGNKYEVDQYFYSPRADVTTGDYAALLAFTTHYAYPLAILQCPDLAAFQASNPAATVHPFSEVPASHHRMGTHASDFFRRLCGFSQRRFGVFSVSSQSLLVSLFFGTGT